MGCDIHMFVEQHYDGKWNAIIGNSTYNSGPGIDWLDIGRFYILFAALADVRNNYGIKGFSPRGLPEDVTKLIRDEAYEWGPDAHSFSHLYIDDLESIDWEQEVKLQGLVSKNVYLMHRFGGIKPTLWSSKIWGKNVIHLDSESFDYLYDNNYIVDEDGLDYHVRLHWTELLKDLCSVFLEETLLYLKELNEENMIRIVFWFDN